MPQFACLSIILNRSSDFRKCFAQIRPSTHSLIHSLAPFLTQPTTHPRKTHSLTHASIHPLICFHTFIYCTCSLIIAFKYLFRFVWMLKKAKMFTNVSRPFCFPSFSICMTVQITLNCIIYNIRFCAQYFVSAIIVNTAMVFRYGGREGIYLANILRRQLTICLFQFQVSFLVPTSTKQRA